VGAVLAAVDGTFFGGSRDGTQGARHGSRNALDTVGASGRIAQERWFVCEVRGGLSKFQVPPPRTHAAQGLAQFGGWGAAILS
jgi:hypothetical protein